MYRSNKAVYSSGQLYPLVVLIDLVESLQLYRLMVSEGFEYQSHGLSLANMLARKP